MSLGGRRTDDIVKSLRPKATSIINTVRRHRPDYTVILYMGLLMLLGLVIIYSIGPQRANVLNNSYGSTYSDSYFFIKQAVSLLLSLMAFGFMAVLPYKWVTNQAGKLLIIGLASCALLAITGWLGLSIAQCSLGACRWFDLGFFGSLQPSEILKFSMLIFLSGFLGAKISQGKIDNVQETLIPLAIVTAIALLFVVVIQKDLGTGIALTGIIVTMLMVGGISKKIGAIVLAVGLVVGAVLIFSSAHRVERVATFLRGDSSTASDAGSYHIENAKIAIGVGGLGGVGIGNSIQATGYLPEAINDSVFAIMGETFGFIGLVAVIVLFVALLMRLLKITDHLVDIRLKLIAAGVFGWLGSHVILNIASMIGIFPLTGITLPLMSFGGTSMIFIAAALGLVFQLSRYTTHSSRLKEASYEDSSSRRGVRRSRYSSRSSS
jgi:cell division protein FtsW